MVVTEANQLGVAGPTEEVDKWRECKGRRGERRRGECAQRRVVVCITILYPGYRKIVKSHMFTTNALIMKKH